MTVDTTMPRMQSLAHRQMRRLMSQFSMHADDHAMTYNVNATACKLGHRLRRIRGIHGVGCWVGYVITERMCGIV